MGEDKSIIGRHDFWVDCLSVSPKGRTFATGSHDRSVKLWSLDDHKEIRRLTGHTSVVSALAFSPDGQMLASGSHDGSVILWNVESGIAAKRFQPGGRAVRGVQFSPDGKMIAVGSGDRRLRLINIGDSLVVWQKEFRWVPHTLRFADMRRLFIACGTALFELDLADGSVQQWKKPSVSAMEIVKDNDGRPFIWTFDNDALVAFCDINAGKIVRQFTAAKDFAGHGFAVHSTLPVAATSGPETEYRINIWDTESGKQIHTINRDLGKPAGYPLHINCLAFSRDGKLLIAGGNDDCVRVFDVSDIAGD